MDEALAPNLTYEAINIQTGESFEDWLTYYFPSYIAFWSSSTGMSWMEFVRYRWSTFPQALIWAIRGLTTLHRGAAQGDKEAILCARHMYSRGITHLASLLMTRAALSDETLAAAVLLGGYEALDGASDRSWTIHSRGIRQLIRARGPSAHKHGIGRTLLLSWRPYLVADAFIHDEPCFLGSSEWTCDEIAGADDQWLKSSFLGQTIDSAFSEVAKCPGYFATTKDIMMWDRDSDLCILAGLSNSILDSRENLVRLHGMLNEKEFSASFVGGIPSVRASIFVRGSCHGINSAIALLDQLIAILRSHLNGKITRRQRNSMARREGDKDPWLLFAETQSLQSLCAMTNVSLASRDLNEETLSGYAIGDRLDTFSLTMGMGCLLPDACGCPQFSARLPLLGDDPFNHYGLYMK